jgi:hypothetical protein
VRCTLHYSQLELLVPSLGVYPPGASLCRRVTCCTAVVYTALIEADKVEHASLFVLCATVYSLPLVLLVLVGLLQLLCPNNSSRGELIASDHIKSHAMQRSIVYHLIYVNYFDVASCKCGAHSTTRS